MWKYLLYFLSFCLLSSSAASAQTRVLVGVDGGYEFNNYFLGPQVAVEVPVGRVEVFAQGSLFPLQVKPSYGSGWAYSWEAGPTVWFTHTSGIEGSYERSGYTVTKVAKAESFITAGYAYKHTMVGFPTRFHLDFLKEVQNGLIHGGTESNDLEGGIFGWDTLLGCTKFACVRSKISLPVARVKNQGNPVCDGTLGGKVTCPRTSDISGGFEANLMFEFPRAKNEYALF